jgi:GT2 family glycosyltransferase
MSGDVIPRAPGWLAALRELLDSSLSIGAVAPKLLREDDSIAHAGALYVRGPVRWRRTLPLAGLARTIAPASSPRRVQAISDACFMIRTELFQSIGGFTEVYFADGDEAGDLSLWLDEATREIWYQPDGELYLLDRAPRRKPSPVGRRFNERLFDRRWRGLLDYQATLDPAPTLASGVPEAPEIRVSSRSSARRKSGQRGRTQDTTPATDS